MAHSSGAPMTLTLSRSAQSGIYTLTANWQAVFSDSCAQPWIFYGGYINLTNMVDGDVVEVRVLKTMASGGTAAVASQISYSGLQPVGRKLVPVSSIIDVYGIEVDVRQTLVFANYITIATEWFPAKRPGV